jgi:MFS superfamily sulfate permease-like transporter
MKNETKFLNFKNIKHDLPAGLTVFFIALPLCLGIALASGAPLYSGILSGIIGGLMVSLISKSVYGVSGPAAGLSTIVAAAIISLGDFQIFLLSVMVAGLFQLILGVFKLGGFANYFPSSVIKGMLAAIGIILISKQIPLAMGYDQKNFWSNLFTPEVSQLGSHISSGVILISVISLVLLVLLQQPFAKKLKAIPAPLLVVVISVMINLIFTKMGSSLALNEKQLVNIPSNMFGNLVFPDFTKFFSTIDIWKNGLVIGIVATLETLLCVEAIDKLDPHKRTTPVNRELIAQGIGNMTCGLLGGIPMTAVIVRGSANINSGAKSKLSAFVHGLLLFLAVLLIPSVLNLIPYAALAAILLITGFNLTKPALYKNTWKLGVKQFVPFILTIVVIMLEDLLVGVGVGLLVSLYFIIQNNFKANYNIKKTLQNVTETYTITLHNNVTFLNKIKLKNELDKIPEYSVITIDGSHTHFVDYDVLEIISEFATKAHDKHIEMNLIGIERVTVLGSH